MVYQARILSNNRTTVQKVVFYIKSNNLIQITTLRKTTRVEFLNMLQNGVCTFLVLYFFKSKTPCSVMCNL